MITPLVVPRFGLTMTEARVAEWLKREGDPVAPGEVVVTLETDKALTEIEAPVGGVLRMVLQPAGAVVPVAALLGYLADRPDEPLPDQPASTLPGEPAAAAGATGASAPAAPVASSEPRASPAARKLARELGVDLGTVRATGPGGRITAEDVERAAAATRSVGQDRTDESRIVPLAPMRRAIARQMVDSVRTVPQFTLEVDVDLEAAARARERLLPEVERAAGVRLSYTDLFALAVVRALLEHPTFNGHFEGSADDGQLRLFSAVHLGLAVAVDDGLLVPVIRHASQLTLPELARRRYELELQARAGRLSASDLAGATFTISNLGSLGVDRFKAIVNPPEIAILAIGRIGRRPVVLPDGQLASRLQATLAVSADHRAVDGAAGAAFLAAVAMHLQKW